MKTKKPRKAQTYIQRVIARKIKELGDNRFVIINSRVALS